MFDANLVLCNGSADWSYANLVTSNYGSPTSATRNAGGFVVLDLLAFSGTPIKGIDLVLILDDDNASGSLVAIAQGCSSVAFGSNVEELARFDLGAVTSGVLLGTEAPCTVRRRIYTKKRYLRVDCSCGAGEDLLTGYIMATPVFG